MKLRLENLWKLRTAIINRPMRLQLIICHKKELLSSFSSIKLVLIRNKCYQRQLVCTIMINEWCKILAIKTLTEVNRQRWSRGHKARGRGQGHKKNPRPRPRTAFSRTEPLEAKDRNARGQGQGPRTQPQAFSEKKGL